MLCFTLVVNVLDIVYTVWQLFLLLYSTTYNDNTTSWHDWALPLLVPLSTSARPSNRLSFFGDVQPCVWKLLLVAAAASKIDVTSHKATQSLLTIRKPMEPPCFSCTSITSQPYIFSALSTRALMKFMVSQGWHLLHNPTLLWKVYSQHGSNSHFHWQELHARPPLFWMQRSMSHERCHCRNPSAHRPWVAQ